MRHTLDLFFWSPELTTFRCAGTGGGVTKLQYFQPHTRRTRADRCAPPALAAMQTTVASQSLLSFIGCCSSASGGEKTLFFRRRTSDSPADDLKLFSNLRQTLPQDGFRVCFRTLLTPQHWTIGALALDFCRRLWPPRRHWTLAIGPSPTLVWHWALALDHGFGLARHWALGIGH